MNTTRQGQQTQTQAGGQTGGQATKGKYQHALTTYISDMLALEQQIKEQVSRQEEVEETKRYPEAARVTANVRAVAQAHISALQSELDAQGGHPAAGIKSAWASILGSGTAAVEAMRKTVVSKNLRDMHAILSLAAVSYEMLHTTALALGEQSTAQQALRFLQDEAGLIMNISRCLPQIVVNELQAEGLETNTSVVQQVCENIQQAWKQTGQAEKPFGT